MFHHRSLIVLLVFAALSSKVVATGAQVEPPQALRQRSPRGCRLNICFALDGSESVSKSDFENFRTFVLALVGRLSKFNRIQVAGAQYGFVTLPISPLTDDISGFRQQVHETAFEAAESTRVSGGMVYCIGQLRSPPELLPRARIVILGSGEAELGIDPTTVADIFRDGGGSMFGIGVDNASTRTLAEFLGRSNVFTLRPNAIRSLVDEIIPALCSG